ncbi:MAG: cupin domain-containing protein [Ilumatobacteraceae bacterium]
MAHHPQSSPEVTAVINRFALSPHPEGGWFAETFRDPATDPGGRSRSTAILYLLADGDVSARHRVDAAEVWHHYAGGPLELTIDGDVHILGDDLAAGQRPQIVVSAGQWQSARPLANWTLAGCTVAPGFEFAGFELGTD